jgi:murein DD-endopeptidase MepM/ murein hydrolase activator NlpD
VKGCGAGLGWKLSVALCVVALLMILLCWLIQVILFAEIIEFIWETFVPLGLNPIPLLEWFCGPDMRYCAISLTSSGFPLVGYQGPVEWIDGFPVPYQPTYFFGFSQAYFGGTKFHTGIDFPTPMGTTVVTTMGGQVTTAGYVQGYGYLVVVENDGVQTFYGHLSEIDVSVGQYVQAGSVVGQSGNTGFSTAPHLHYEIRIDGKPVDPLQTTLPDS